MQEPHETRVRSLGQEIPWRRAWQPTPVFLPGGSHGQRSIWAAVHRVTKSQTRLKQLGTHICIRTPYETQIICLPTKTQIFQMSSLYLLFSINVLEKYTT